MPRRSHRLLLEREARARLHKQHVDVERGGERAQRRRGVGAVGEHECAFGHATRRREHLLRAEAVEIALVECKASSRLPPAREVHDDVEVLDEGAGAGDETAGQRRGDDGHTKRERELRPSTPKASDCGACLRREASTTRSESRPLALSSRGTRLRLARLRLPAARVRTEGAGQRTRASSRCSPSRSPSRPSPVAPAH